LTVVGFFEMTSHLKLRHRASSNETKKKIICKCLIYLPVICFIYDVIKVRMMDERSGESSRSLCGHSGAVHSVSFAPDRTLLLSASEDSTIR